MACLRWKKKLLIAVKEPIGLNLSKRGKICFGIFAFIVLLIISGFICYLVLTWKPWSDEKKTPFDISQLYKPSDSELGRYKNAAISTDAEPCAKIGREALENGGSAVDAAIATLLCMGVVNCHSMGLGGGFIMTFYNKEKQEVKVLDAREVAPEAADENMFNGNKTNAQIGGLAIAVPGELLGYDIAYRKYGGKLPWKELFIPSIELCRKGFPVGRHLAKALQENRNIILNEESLRNVLVNKNTGDIYKEGEIMKRLDLAETLEMISNSDSDVLYASGETRRKFVADIQSFGGIITEKDLENYAPVWRSPTKITLKNNFTVYSAPPPGSGPLLSYMLNILDGYNLTNNTNWQTLDQVSLTFHRVIETFKFAYAQRTNLEDSKSHTVEKTIENLLSKRYADETRAKIYDTKTFHDPEYYGVKQYMKEDDGTGHLSIVAPNGDAVSVTSTINLYFGCKRMSPSTGIMLNNEMDDFSLPNITNYFGVPPTEKNRIKPYRRPMSSMSPTIILNEKGELWLVIGGNGGTQITSGTTLVTMQMLWLDKNIKEAIDMPRIHHQLFPDYVLYEKKFPKDILNNLKNLGHNIEENKDRLSVIIGIHRHKNGTLYSNSDYRKNGKTDGF